MNNISSTIITEPDSQGNVFHIESAHIKPQTVCECVEWYWSQRHHVELSERESNKKIWISNVELPDGSTVRAWKYL